MDKSKDKNNIKEILKNIFKENSVLPDFNIVLLKKNWIQIIGDKLYQQTVPKKINNKKLIIYCRYQGLINILPFYKNEILENIKKFVAEVVIDDIIFTLKDQ